MLLPSVHRVLLAALPAAPAASAAGATSAAIVASGGRSPVAYALAGVLAVAALYLAVRLLIWDRINQETPNQEEPMLGESEEPGHESR
jgi:hypothetical protein